MVRQASAPQRAQAARKAVAPSGDAERVRAPESAKAAPARADARMPDAQDDSSPYSDVAPEVAIEHFREALRAKQARVRQGPSYPAPNAYSGRSAVPVDDASTDEDGGDRDA